MPIAVSSRSTRTGAPGSGAPSQAGGSRRSPRTLDMVSADLPGVPHLSGRGELELRQRSWDGVNTAVSEGALVVSNSWGAQEWPGETTEDSSTSTILAWRSSRPPATTATATGSNTRPRVAICRRRRRDDSPSAWPTAPAFLVADLEVVWGGTGSGCSLYEPKPAWQHDSGCSNRTDNDVSADAQPEQRCRHVRQRPKGG